MDQEPPEVSSRPESGTMQFGPDWPGIFIRGDCAFGFAQSLETLTAENLDPGIRSIFAAQAKALAKLLHSCNVAVNPKAQQVLKPWKECVESKKMIYPLMHGMDHENAPPGLRDEDCFGYYTSRDLAVAALDKYFERIGDPWPYDEKEKMWKKGDYYVYIDEQEMDAEID